MRNTTRISLLLSLAILATLGLSESAGAAALFHVRTHYAQTSEAECLRVASRLARKSFTNAKLSPFDAAGGLPGREFDGVFISIVCIQDPAGTTALSIAAGPNVEATKKAAERVGKLLTLEFGPVLVPTPPENPVLKPPRR